MIEESQLNKLAVRYQTVKLNVVREYYQHLFLSYFYRQKGAGRVYFKGGTALRIIYGSPRFSEDLDFSAGFKEIAKLEKMIVGALGEIEREGVEVELEEAKKTSGGYLAIVRFDKTEIQLQISLRAKEEEGEVVTVVSDFVPPYTIVSLKQEQLVEEKVRALLSRKKPRDFYDLYYILRAGLISVEQKKLLGSVAELLRSTEINFEMELKQFLPKSHWAVISDFKQVLEKEIERN